MTVRISSLTSCRWFHHGFKCSNLIAHNNAVITPDFCQFWSPETQYHPILVVPKTSFSINPHSNYLNTKRKHSGTYHKYLYKWIENLQKI